MDAGLRETAGIAQEASGVPASVHYVNMNKL